MLGDSSIFLSIAQFFIHINEVVCSLSLPCITPLFEYTTVHIYLFMMICFQCCVYYECSAVVNILGIFWGTCTYFFYEKVKSRIPLSDL